MCFLKRYLAIFLLPVFLISATTFVDPPEVSITNGFIHARLYLPDADNGYYRGSRFDWSGVIPELTCNGHSYYGQWNPDYGPRVHDAIMGPVEDFLPVGFNEAKPGGSFLKIGIGILQRPDTSVYSIVPPYEILNGGKWEVKTNEVSVEFQHTLSDTAYSYVYKKTIELIKDKPEMILSHTFKNTGKKTIETTVYDHNFFMLDSQSTQPGFVITLPFDINSAGGNEDLAVVDKNQIIFKKKLANNEHVYYGDLHGYSDNAKDYDIKVENKNTGAAAEITCDRPLAKLAFWCASSTVCPEPFIHIKVNPGETFRWKIFYKYYSLKQQEIK
jgi:hypothetical protein